MSKSLQEEWAWIDAHPEEYDSPLHAESVKRNIEKRYRIAELEVELSDLTAKHEALSDAYTELGELLDLMDEN